MNKVIPVKNKKYTIGSHSWNHNDPMWSSGRGWDNKPLHDFLGPCPGCGTVCFDYGGGWRCCGLYCFYSAGNPISNVGPSPSWWQTNINVNKDGDTWFAYWDDFINLQESPSGWGTTPQKAVDELLKEVAV